MTAAPRLESDRLVLRAHRVDDFPPFAAFFASDAARWVGGPMAVEQCWDRFAGDVGAWELVGSGAWALEDKATGGFVGQVGLNRPPHFPEAELGWILMPGFEGCGYATEAARAARDHAYGALGWSTAVSYVNPENRRSIAVAGRLGCTADPDAARFWPGDIVFRHPAPEAPA